MPNRLAIQDDSLFPIQAFFNAIGDGSFVRMLDSLTNGIGFSINDCDCSFPADLEPDEKTFDGVRFSLFERNIVISTAELARFLRIACDEFVKTCPNETQAVNRLLSRMGRPEEQIGDTTYDKKQ